ncbi:MAG TPA: DUF1549 domain-containing protein [Bryobacteraceae bacterium]|nr:DUF1549 domain-containing protein [Bryobacteraceae bacterium]
MNWNKERKHLVAGGVALFVASSFFVSRADDVQDQARQLSVEHAECAFFGPRHDVLVQGGLAGSRNPDRTLSAMTEQVTAFLAESFAEASTPVAVPGGSRTNASRRGSRTNSIDRYLFAAIADAGVKPALKTTDVEFVRRVTLDLTGRIPTAERVAGFVSDGSPDKRSKLIEELLASPEFVDKWTMYFGDLFNNITTNTQSGVQHYAPGRNAFYNWIKQQIASNRPYNEVAADIIAVQGTNSYDNAQGHMNWLVNGLINNGPAQDTYDQQAANIAETFLGLTQQNCLLCHNGRGHLDSLSLWGKTSTRTQAWGLSAFLAKTAMGRTPVNGAVNNQPYYWNVRTNPAARDYQLNTTTGNRPARCLNAQPLNEKGQCPATGTALPVYPFSGNSPQPGEDYKTALAREVTNDFQFSRAAVNYVWKEFFGRGIVNPANQFDLARLDPDNPPPAPWTLQPSNARLLRVLAQEFIAGGYDLKSLMRQITNSEAYQLSARYADNWDSNNEPLFARKLVRRLWGEEIHDAIAQSSGILPSYNVEGIGRVSWAMQLPEPRGMPDGQNGAIARFLDSFIRGNRDDEDRRQDGSLAQALNLMNDNFVMSRIRANTVNGVPSLLQRYLGRSDEELVNSLYLSVLSRYPNDAEKQIALSSLKTGTRAQRAEDLLWSLYNKVDFIFNY